MRKYPLHIFLALMALSATSCSDGWDDNVSDEGFVGVVAPTLSVGGESLDFTDAASTKELSISSNCPWTAKCDATWVTLSKPHGNGGGILSITVEANTHVAARATTRAGERRTATITISNGIKSISVDVTQAFMTEALQVSPSTLTYTFAGGDNTIDVQANVTWTVSSNASWLTVKKNTEETAFVATASPNISTTARQATITVKGINKQATIAVTQAAPQAPTIATLTVTDINKHEAKCTFKVTSPDLDVTEYGICYSPTVQQPDESNAQVVKADNGGKGTSRVFGLYNLKSKTTYYLRPYVVTSLGRQYGQVVTFTTLISAPNEGDNETPKD